MANAERTITEETAQFIIDTNYADLPGILRSEARRCILDGLAVMLAGTTEHCTRIVCQYIGDLGVSGPCRVPGIDTAYFDGVVFS